MRDKEKLIFIILFICLRKTYYDKKNTFTFVFFKVNVNKLFDIENLILKLQLELIEV